MLSLVRFHLPDASYDGGISSSSDDGVLLGRALREELLLLERDFAGGFEAGSAGGGGGSSAYAGEIKALAGSTVPAGWLVCDGRALSRIDFSSLFAAIGTTWGKGDGSTTFNIPDLRGRTAIGAGKGKTGGSVTNAGVSQAAATQHDLGSYDGSEMVTFKKPTAKLTKATATFTKSTFQSKCTVGGHSYQRATNNPAFLSSCTLTGHGGSLAFNGGSLSLDGGSLTSDSSRLNMQPFAAVQYIIKT